MFIWRGRIKNDSFKFQFVLFFLITNGEKISLENLFYIFYNVMFFF